MAKKEEITQFATPSVPAGQGGMTVVITVPNGNQNYCQATYSSADATRIFQAWQNRAGPIDPATGKPNGTVPQFTTWCAQLVLNQVNSFITSNEQTTVVPPNITVGNG